MKPLTAAILACKLGGMRVATPARCPPTPGCLIADDEDKEGGRPGRDDDDGVAVLGVGTAEVTIDGGDEMDDDGVDAGRGGCMLAVDVVADSAAETVAGSTTDPDDIDAFMPASACLPVIAAAAAATAPKSFALMPAAVHASIWLLLGEMGTGEIDARPSIVLADTFAAAGRPSSAATALARGGRDARSDSSDSRGNGPGLLLVEDIVMELSIPCISCCCRSVRLASVGTMESLTATGNGPTPGDKGVGGGFFTPPAPNCCSPDILLVCFCAFYADECWLRPVGETCCCFEAVCIRPF